jgi:hypothetical protein
MVKAALRQWGLHRRAVACAVYSKLQHLQHVGRGIDVLDLRRRRLRAETRSQPAGKKSFMCGVIDIS